MSAEDQEQMMIDDWRAAVEDLKDNVRHEIITLTNLARELTSIAFPIAEILEQHIKKVGVSSSKVDLLHAYYTSLPEAQSCFSGNFSVAPPQRKLPAIYLLDSIVKNVGTPYTLFFGKNLYQSFMDVYASVDQRTRHKLEEMLQTWKEPVPGSIDTTPVFPTEVVKPIENALIKARTSALQAQQEQMRTQMRSRGARPPAGYRATPTPPNTRQPFNQPPYTAMNGHRPDSAFGQQPPYTQQNMPYAAAAAQAPVIAPLGPPQVQYGAPVAHAGISIDSLNNDIEQLIVAVGAALGRSPHSPDIQTELKALLALQGLLRDKHRSLPQEQLVAVRNQVDHLAVKYRVSFVARLSVTPTLPLPAAPFHAPMHHQPQQTHSVAPVPSPAAPPAPVSLDSLLGKGALAALLSRNSATPQPASTPQMAHATLAALQSPAPQRAERQLPATPDPMALLGALRGAGLLPPPTPQPGQTLGKPTAPPSAPVAATSTTLHAASTAAGAPSLDLASIIAKAQRIAATAKAGPVISSGGISFTESSLLQPRPHLYSSVYQALGVPCSQCGRRFLNDDDGKKKKTAHMDWHFRVHQRMIEAEKRGQHRSWYVDQSDWIRNVEAVDLDHTDNPGGSDNPTNAAGPSGHKTQNIPVPDDGDNTNSVCPICQEKFQTKWLDEAQEWVWTDALRVGGRAFHASCYEEVTKESIGGTPLYGGAGRATPDRVLGKRKAEDDILSLRGGRIKTDS